MTVARIWTGATSSADADAYQSYMEEVAKPGYLEVAGNQGLIMLRRDRDDDRVEFTMITLWDDLESVEGFAGDDPEVAHFYAKDEEFLVERELKVKHYVVYG